MNVAKGTIVFEKGKICDKLVIVLESALAFKSQPEKIITPKGSLFGEFYLPTQN